MMSDLGDGRVSAAYALAHTDPEFFEGLSPAERLVLPHMMEFWRRPNQIVPKHRWRTCGFVAGRGFGKGHAIAGEINWRVERGLVKHLALMAPTEDRIEEAQVKFLVDMSPPWFRAEPYSGTVRWPCGLTATGFTPRAPGRPRSENIDLTWLTEIVDWAPATRRDAFDNIMTATRIGRSQVLWDTTSMGRNDVIKHLMELHSQDAHRYPIIRGASFDNPMLSTTYLQDLVRRYTGRRYEEEVEGRTFLEAAGALWQDAWIKHVPESPTHPDLRLVSIDPGLSTHKDADETGIIEGCVSDGRAYVERDLSGKHPPEVWGDIAVGAALERNSAGFIVERNHIGDNAVFVLRSRAKERGCEVRVLPRDQRRKPFPGRTPGVLYVREMVANTSKASRAAGPAAETERGRVLFVGVLPRVEEELTTYEPETGAKSPNRFDALSYLVTELLDLDREQDSRASRRRVTAATQAAASLSRKLGGAATARPLRVGAGGRPGAGIGL